MIVLDIGAAPGSWSQYASKIIKNGKIISIDLKEMEEIKGTIQIRVILLIRISKKIRSYTSKEIDVVMSDMAVNTTGIKNIDSFKQENYVKKQ